MKKSFMTRVLAVSLSTAMAFSVPVVGNLTTALADTASSSSAALAMNYTQKNAEAGTRMVFKLQGSQAKYWKVLRAASQNKEVATVDNTTSKKVAVNAVSEGSANIIVRVEKTAGKKSVGKQKRLKIAIDVEKGATKDATLSAVAQSTTTKLTATLSAAVESVKAADFVVTREDKTVIPIKSVALDSADKTKVTIETYTALNDGKEYTVSYTAPTDAKTVSEAKFKATDGTIADLALKSSVITAGVAEKFEIQALDATGVILNEYTKSAAQSNNIVVSVTPAAGGYVDGDNLYLQNIGDTAKVTAVYHTYKYENGVETGLITKDFTITAVADASVMSTWNYTIAKDNPLWTSASYRQDTTVAVAETGKSAFFQFKDDKGNDKTTSYQVASSDTSKLLIAEGTIDTVYGMAITGVSEGTAYIIVKDNNGNVVNTLPVTVKSKKVATKLVLDYPSVRLSTSANIDPKKIKATIKDQYGADMDPADKAVKVTAISWPGASTKSAAQAAIVADTITKGAFEIDTANLAIGTYTYTVESTAAETNETVSATFTAVVASAKEEGAISYTMSIDGVEADNSVDITVDDVDDIRSLNVRVVKNVDGVAKKYIPFTYALTNAAGTLSVYSFDAQINAREKQTMALSVISNSAINAQTTFIQKCVGAGVYVIKARFIDEDVDPTKVNEISQTITVKDNQVIPSLDILGTDSMLYPTLEDVFKSSDMAKFSYDGDTLVAGKKYAVKSFNVLGVNNPNTEHPKTIVVSNVGIEYIVNTKNVSVEAVIPVNRTFTNVADWGNVSVNGTVVGNQPGQSN